MRKILFTLLVSCSLLLVFIPVGACYFREIPISASADSYDIPYFDVPYDFEEECWYITFPFNYVGLYYDYFTLSSPVVLKVYSDFSFEFIQYRNDELVILASFSTDKTFAGTIPFYVINQTNNTISLNQEVYLSATSTSGLPRGEPSDLIFHSNTTEPYSIYIDVVTDSNQSYVFRISGSSPYHVFTPFVAPFIHYDLQPFDDLSGSDYWIGYEDALNGVTIPDYLNNTIDSFMDITLFGSSMTFGGILSIGFGLILMGIAIKVFLGG